MNRSWPSHAFESGLTVPAEWLDDVLLNPPLLPWSEFWPHFSTPLKPQRRLGGLPGLPKNAVLPTIIIKEEDRKLLAGWQTKRRIPIHIWHVFYDAAYGLSFDRAEEWTHPPVCDLPRRQACPSSGGTGRVAQSPIRTQGPPMSKPALQSIPSSGPAREALRQKGQFWTPAWLARAMASWVVKEHPPLIFDPAVGPGTFFAAAREVGFRGGVAGFELDESALADSYKLGLASSELAQVVVGDFIGSKITFGLPAVISNPPYIRHHRLSDTRKNELRALALQCLGFPLDGRVGLHFYFLLKCLEHLAPDGRLAFLVPADVCEGVSSAAAWRRLSERFRIEAVLTFGEAAAPFPNVDTNALVLLLSRRSPANRVRWLRVLKPDPDAILAALTRESGNAATTGSVEAQWRALEELLGTGMSRPPRPSSSPGVPLSGFARVVRGIATGANEFFFLTRAQVRELGLDERYFQRALGRTRDCTADTLPVAHLDQLDHAARPTWLLRLGKEPKDVLPVAMQAYLEQGERMGLPERPLIKTRRPWYRMEQRTAPPLLFAYLGRRDCRFILNRAGVVPLTCFLCVYPWDDDRGKVERLWRALNHPDTLANLVFVAKSYGGGALKVEPRQLEMLEIPLHVLREARLETPQAWTQLALLETPAHRSPTESKQASASTDRDRSLIRSRSHR